MYLFAKYNENVYPKLPSQAINIPIKHPYLSPNRRCRRRKGRRHIGLRLGCTQITPSRQHRIQRVINDREKRPQLTIHNPGNLRRIRRRPQIHILKLRDDIHIGDSIRTCEGIGVGDVVVRGVEVGVLGEDGGAVGFYGVCCTEALK
jgi:hypothetical protein